MDALAKANNNQPLTFWSPLSTDATVLSNKLFSWKLDSVHSHLYLFAQIPYYYYRSTDHLIKYDSVLRPGRSYISFPSQVKDRSVDTIYAYYDPLQKDSLIVFKIRSGEIAL